MCTITISWNLVALKVGDVDFTADVRNLMPRSAEPTVRLSTPDRPVKAGETVTVPFFAHTRQTVIGWQIALRIDPALAELARIEGVGADHYYWQPDGWLRILRDDGLDKQYDGQTPLFTLHLTARKATTIAHLIEQTAIAAPLNAEIYTNDNNRFRTFPLQWQTGTFPQSSLITVLPPTPNPFTTRPAWSVELSEASPLQLELFNSLGQSCFSLQEIYNTGYHILEAPESVFSAPGIYFYVLKMSGCVVSSGRIIKDR
jgi:hypothetical protein